MATISSVLTKVQMQSIVDSNMPNTFYTVCQDDSCIYLYNKSNTVDAETGKFRKLTGSAETDILNIAGILMDNYSNEQSILYSKELVDLGDVSISSPINGQVLKYDATNEVWYNGEDTGGSGGGSSTFLTQTLTAGSTSVTFTNLPSSGNYSVDFYTSSGINYNSIDTSVAGQCTLTFTAQAADIIVYCELKPIPAAN